MSKEYEISKLIDLAKVPADKLDDFFIDLKQWILSVKLIEEVGQIPIDTVMVWIDDDQHNMTINISTKG